MAKTMLRDQARANLARIKSLQAEGKFPVAAPLVHARTWTAVEAAKQDKKQMRDRLEQEEALGFKRGPQALRKAGK